jgi:cytochrome c oxidase assembly protein subunit 15
MSEPKYHPWLHRFAVITACLAICFPVILGAQTTTKAAGMAFPDWPSSDGYNMLTYPWFLSVGDKFLEHGHRLAGAMIGLVSICLAVSFVRNEPRLWVKTIAVAVLLAVIVQGLLGGNRVLMNDSRLAFAHGMFAALVFGLMVGLAQVTSRGWTESGQVQLDRDPDNLKPWAILLPLIVFGQYFLGGMLRHLGTALFEHMGVAVIALLALLSASIKTRNRHRGPPSGSAYVSPPPTVNPRMSRGCTFAVRVDGSSVTTARLEGSV